jgi:hypothetical protein
MYRVKAYFTDLQDNDYAYNVGDKFPRDGMAVTFDRIQELSGTQNKRGIALIEEVRDVAKPSTISEKETGEKEEATPVENEPRKRGRKHKGEE